MEYVWYLSYGSNMYEDRFLCYIKGEKYKDAAKVEQGCRDSSLPIDEKTIVINNELFFAFNAGHWQNMGVGFITRNKNKDAKTFAKMYLITKEQFEDVVKQENRINVNDDIIIDYDKLNKDGEVILFKNRHYGLLLKIDEIDGIPAYTFTLPFEPESYSKPSKEYLGSIIRGIKLNFGDISDEIVESFKNLEGIKGKYNIDELKEFVASI